MGLILKSFVLGPLQNNTFLLIDEDSREAALIDPAFGVQAVEETLIRENWRLTAIWLTHAHFDHFAGAALAANFAPAVPIGIHPLDLPLWQEDGGARNFGFAFERGPEPAFFFADNQILSLGKSQIEVRHVPGHSPGHILFYSSELNSALVGDLIFFHGIGRTDLPGGSEKTLYQSIYSRVFSLPDTTRLFPGHGQITSVQEEKRWHGLI